MNNYADNRLKNSALTAVLVPITQREVTGLANLFLVWQGFAQLAAVNGLEQPRCKLIVSLDCAPNKNIDSRIKHFFEHLGLSSLFRSLDVVFCDIPPEDNIYIRNMEALPSTIPALGLKSGPNTQFFRSILDFCGGENVVLLNEIDCFPVSRDWLIRISRLVHGSEPFWILGSPYRGFGKLGPNIVTHINGNALYGVGSDGFKDVLMKYWHEGLVAAVPSNPDLAYDIFLEYSRHEMVDPRTWRNASLEKVRFFTALLCKVRHTDLIHNLSGTTETTGHVKIDLSDYLVTNPLTTLIHGKFMYDQVLQGMIDAIRRVDDSFFQSWSDRTAKSLEALGTTSLAHSLTGVLSSAPRSLKYA